jgi:hypothetical protein
MTRLRFNTVVGGARALAAGRRTSQTLLSLAAATVLALTAPAAYGASVRYTVNSTLDMPDASPGGGRCATASGTCTLRAAMMEADTHPGNKTTIVLPAGVFKLTIPPGLLPYVPYYAARGALYNRYTATVVGAGARRTIIDANHLDRAFFNLGHLTIKNLTITNGNAPSPAQTIQATVDGGGAIANSSWLELDNVSLTHNTASYGGALMDGQLLEGSLAVPAVTFAEIFNSTISDNVATDGAGGLRFDAAAVVVNSTITGNRVTAAPGPTYGGSPNGEGGGIDARGQGKVEIVNSTIVDNYATSAGAGVNISPYTGTADPTLAPGPLTLLNTIIANNTNDTGQSNCSAYGGDLVSLGHNIASDNTCNLTATGDRPHTNPLLGQFGDHGGPTDTYPLLRGSPAIGAGRHCPSTDQRGLPRSTKACDVGAFQTQRHRRRPRRPSRPTH